MAERYLFFNSAAGDPRKYQAQDFAEYFGSLLSSGLLSDGLNLPGVEVSVVEGTLNVSVAPGKAIVGGHLYHNTTPLTLTHAIPEQSNDRIDRIVLRLDLRNQSRWIRAFVKEGVAAINPVAPELQRDETIYELSLAQVRVRANTSTLDPEDVLDERDNNDVCGLATAKYPAMSAATKADNVVINDDAGLFTGVNVEDALTELAIKEQFNRIEKSDKNELGIWQRAVTKRADGTLLQESIMSNPDVNGNLQTRTITTFAKNGTNVFDVTVWSIAYDEFSDVMSEEVVI